MADEVFILGDQRVGLGERKSLNLTVSHSYAGLPVVLPVTVWRAPRPGPSVFVMAAVHGDEINGTGVVRELIINSGFDLVSGSLVLVPVANLLGFERHTRYLPDRRDLNRAFPGSSGGSLASRLARTIFEEIVLKCDYGIDLHTAAVRRTNFPNVRADLNRPAVARLAAAFGCELIVNGRGPRGSLRREACKSDCPTIILEAGEVWKIEPTVVEVGTRGVRNVLIRLGMVEGEAVLPDYQAFIDESRWVRADAGGILQFHVGPGSLVEEGEPIATNSNLHGEEQNVVVAPTDGIIMGMTTLPAVSPGDPICHIAIPRDGIAGLRKAERRATEGSLHERVRDDLSTNFSVSEPADEHNPA